MTKKREYFRTQINSAFRGSSNTAASRGHLVTHILIDTRRMAWYAHKKAAQATENLVVAFLFNHSFSGNTFCTNSILTYKYIFAPGVRPKQQFSSFFRLCHAIKEVKNLYRTFKEGIKTISYRHIYPET
jgi:hypothetical protein